MFTPRYNWGVVPLILGIALLGASIALGVFVMTESGTTVRTVVLPAIAGGLGIAALFAGHVSYPRVHNLKVYLAGYLIGLFAVLYSALVGITPHLTLPLPSAGLPMLLGIVTIANIVMITYVPALVGFRVTRWTTWSVVLIELVALLGLRLFPAQFDFVDWFAASELISYPYGIMGVLLLAALVGNIVLRPPSFHLRGLFVGCALLVAGSYAAASLLPDLVNRFFVPSDIVMLAVLATPLLLLVGILMHVLARMEHRALYDPLLQIYNRQYADRVLEEQTGVNTRPPFTVMLFDIDHFKHVNDTFGHQAGDKVLFAVAQELQNAIVPDGVLCRYGGEELIAFFSGKRAEETVAVAQRARAAIEQLSTSWQRTRINVTISVGLSERASGRQQLELVVRAADKALYIAKERGRNQVRYVRLKQA